MKQHKTKRGISVDDVISFASEQSFDDIVVIGKEGNDINYYVSTDNYDDTIGMLERVKINIINTIDR